VSQLEHHHLIRNLRHDTEIVRDEQHGCIVLGLQFAN
jgi:hypothetical protein